MGSRPQPWEGGTHGEQQPAAGRVQAAEHIVCEGGLGRAPFLQGCLGPPCLFHLQAGRNLCRDTYNRQELQEPILTVPLRMVLGFEYSGSDRYIR